MTNNHAPLTAPVQIRETFERPSAEYPEGSYLFRVGSRFVMATGRFEGLAEEFDPEGLSALRLATAHRALFLHFGNPTDLTWMVKSYGSAPVKEGPKAMVLCQEQVR